MSFTNIPNSTGGGGGADSDLSNLTSPTAINQDLIFDKANPLITATDNLVGAGVDIAIEGSDGFSVGGAVNLTGGNSTNNSTNGGAINLTGGTPGTGGQFGAVNAFTGLLNVQSNPSDPVQTLFNDFTVYVGPAGISGAAGLYFNTDLGQSLSLFSGNGSDTDQSGGLLTVGAGNATNGDANGGGLELDGGNGIGTGNGGDLIFNAGQAGASGHGGDLLLTARQVLLTQRDSPGTGGVSIKGVSKLYDGTASPQLTIDINNDQLIRSDTGTVAVDWFNRVLTDNTPVTSIDWGSRALIDSSTNTTVDWDSKRLITTGGAITVDWGTGVLTATGGSGSSVDWQNKQLISSGNYSINWANRTLHDDTSAVVSSWSSAGFTTGILNITSGADKKAGTAVLVAGTVTVTNSSITANSQIFVTSQVDGGVPGFLRVNNKVNATSFDIVSSNVADTSTVAWFIIEAV